MHRLRPAEPSTITYLEDRAPVCGFAAPAAEPDRDAARVAIVHDWCPTFRGGERVLARLCNVFPKAEVFTLFDFLPQEIKDEYFRDVTFHASAANRLPFVRKYYRALFFLCPFLIEQFDVTEYDVVVSSSAAFARGVITRPDQVHLCYVHSPIRYAWDEQFSYLRQARMGFGPKGLAFRYLLHRLRTWDARTANGPDLMLANSSYVRSRIRRIYGRDSLVVHPPVASEELDYVAAKDDYYVAAAFHAPYKRTDLVVRAFARMPSHRLIVVGDDTQSRHLRPLAGANVSFLGHLPRRAFVDKIANARAMVYAGCEDFGIALAEAQACGTPLIAFGRGGARDIVQPLGSSPHPTGVLFERQTVDSVIDAVERFEKHRTAITPEACRSNAERFSQERFDRAMLAALDIARRLRSTAEGTSEGPAVGPDLRWRDDIPAGLEGH